MEIKKILISLSTVSALSAAVIAGTGAFFSDQETVAGNTIQAGTIDLTVDGAPISITDIKPGFNDGSKDFTVLNAGNNDGVLDLHIKNATDSGGTLSEPECVAEGGVFQPDLTCLGNTPVNTLSNKIGIDIGFDLDGDNIIEDTEYLIWSDTVIANGQIDPGELSWGNNLDPNNVVATLAVLNSESMDLSVLPSGLTGQGRKLKISWHMNDAGNEYQGDQTQFDIDFTLHQLNEDTSNINVVGATGINGPTPTPTPPTP